MSPTSKAMGRCVRLLAAWAVMVLWCASRGAAGPSTEPTRVFVGYVYGLPTDIHYAMYTHLCHAFVVSDGQGNLKPNEQVPSHEFAQAAHAANVKVMLSLGGWGWDEQFAAIAADDAALTRYLDAVVRLIDDFDYDGVDVDWEYPDTLAEAKGFNRLVLGLRERLDELGQRKGRPMTLTMAASASPSTLEWLDAPVLIKAMDWINVMTYDYTGEWSEFAGHHSPLFASSKAPDGNAMSTELTMNYLVKEKQIPANRLAMGVPLYGRAFGVAEPYAPTAGVKAPTDGSYDFARLEELKSKQGWPRIWDDETKNAWLVAPDGSRVVGFDDAESATIKSKWARDQGFRGVFFWQINSDRLSDGSNPVQEAARKASMSTTSELDLEPR